MRSRFFIGVTQSFKTVIETEDENISRRNIRIKINDNYYLMGNRNYVTVGDVIEYKEGDLITIEVMYTGAINIIKLDGVTVISGIGNKQYSFTASKNHKLIVNINFNTP